METLRLALLPLPDAPAQARSAVRAWSGVEDDARARLELVVTELVANAVKHAALDDNDVIEVRLDADELALRVEVEDAGIGFTSGHGWCPDADAVGGRGLFLVSTLSSRWGVERANRKTRVWAEINPASSR
jgi:anti-sigma regulatory factor (Ser/Thr protein kinase)